MPVIVHHRGIADLLDGQIGTFGPEWAQAALDVVDAVGMSPDRRQAWGPAGQRSTGCLRCRGPGGEPNEPGDLQKMPTIHAAPPPQNRCRTVHCWLYIVQRPAKP